jgi:hypothetical protein
MGRTPDTSSGHNFKPCCKKASTTHRSRQLCTEGAGGLGCRAAGGVPLGFKPLCNVMMRQPPRDMQCAAKVCGKAVAALRCASDPAGSRG